MFHLFFIFLESPEKPSDLQKASSTSSSVYLTWKKPYDGNSAIEEYFVRYKLLSSGIYTETTVGLNLAYNVTGLKSGVNYRFEVKARNGIAHGIYSEITAATGDSGTLS